MISSSWLFLWLPVAALAESFSYTGTVFFNQMKVYSYNSTADVKSLTFILRAYSGNPDLYIDTPIGSRFASWYSRKAGDDWIVIQSGDRQLTDNKGMNRTFSFGVYGASREKARFRLGLAVEKKEKRTGKRQERVEQRGEVGERGDVVLWPFGAVVGAAFCAIYCVVRRYAKADHYIPLE